MNKQEYLDKLCKKRPEVLEQYNYDLLPDVFLAHDKIPIKCYDHGLFHQKAGSHMFGQGCTPCAIRKNTADRALPTSHFTDKAMAKFGDKYDYSKTVYVKKGVNLTITCPSHGDFSIRPEAHMWSIYGCPKCDYEIPREIRKQNLIDKCNKLYDNKYDYSKVGTYHNVGTRVEIICPNHGSFQQSLFIHSDSRVGCPKCARENDKYTLEEFITKAREVHGDNYDYSKVVYTFIHDKVLITCPKHGDFEQRAGSHLAGYRCVKCAVEGTRLSTDVFIANAREVHGDRYDYSKVVYQGNKQKVEIICPKHGSFFQKPNAHISAKAGCRFCLESRGEMGVQKCLDKYGINYIREYKIKPYLYRYDFYLPDLNIFIEYNGIQHYKPVETFGGEEAFLKVVENDKTKKMIVNYNDGHLIVIKYTSSSYASIEKELIRCFKKAYKFWLILDGRLYVFRNEFEIYKHFNIPPEVGYKDLFLEVKKLVNTFQVLF